MPPDEALSARLSARENISEKLRDIARTVSDTAERFSDLSATATAATQSLGSLERATESVQSAVRAASAHTEVFTEVVDDAGEESSESARQVSALSAAVRSLPDHQAVSIDVDVDRESLRSTLRQFTTDRTVSIDVAESVQRQINAVGDIDIDGTAVARTQIQRVTDAIEDLHGRRAQIGVDTEGFGQARRAIRSLQHSFGGDESMSLSASAETDADVDRAPLSALRRALASLPDSVTTHVETTADTTAIDRARRALSSLPDTVTAHVETAGDTEGATRVGTALAELDGETATVGVRMDGVARAHQAIRNLRSSLGDDSATLAARTQTETDHDPIRAIRAALASLPDTVRTHIETSADTTALESVRTQLGTLPDSKTVTIGTDREFDSLSLPAPETSALRNIDDVSASVSVDTEGVERARALADGFGENLQDVAVSSRIAEDALDALRGAVPGIASASAAAEDLDDSAASVAAGAHLAAEGMDGLSDEAIGAAGSMQLAASRIDETGDEATGAAARIAALSASLGGLSAAGDGTGLSAHLGPLGGSLGTIAATLAALLPMLSSATAATGGLATAAGGAAAAFGGMFYGGILSRAEELVGTTEELETRADAVEKIFENFGKALRDALAPLQTEQFETFSFDLMDGAVETLSDAAVLVNRISPALLELADVVGASYWENEPEFFAELSATIQTFLPLVERLATGALERLPDLLAFMRREGADLAPLFFELGGAILDLLPPVTELGGTILHVALPALTALTRLGEIAAEALTAVPEPILQGAVAMGALVAAAGPVVAIIGSLASTLGPVITAAAGATGVVGTLAAAIGALPISATVLAAGALVGVLTAVASHFGLIDDIVSGLVWTWNSLVETVQFAVNAMFTLYDALGPLGPILLPGVAIMRHFGEILDWAGRVAHVVGQAFQTLGKIAAKFLSPVAKFLDLLNQSAEQSGGVDLSGFKMGGGGESPSGPGGTGGLGGGYAVPAQYGANRNGDGDQSGQSGATTPAPSATPYRKNNRPVTVNYYGSESDATTTEIEQAVSRAIREEERRGGTGNYN